MAFHVVYRMLAKEGASNALAAALHTLREKVIVFPAVERIEILKSLDVAHTFLFIEHWQSKEKYGEAASQLSKAVFAPVKEALGAPPAREEFETLG